MRIMFDWFNTTELYNTTRFDEDTNFVATLKFNKFYFMLAYSM